MGCGSSNSREVGIDFESWPKPTGDETKVYAECEAAIADSKRVLQSIEDYKGCRELVRVAMSTPTKENEQKAFEGLLVAVESISLFFEFSRVLEQAVPALIRALSPGRAEGKHPIALKPALTRQLAEIFDFTLRFDQTRMMRPNLSNDFSYYRRLLPKFSKHPAVKVKDDEASGMALFTAEHIPMMATLAKATKAYIDRSGESGGSEAVANVLSTLANSCMRTVKSKRSQAQTFLCLRAMTGAIVLHDQVTGLVFLKRSGVAMRECLLLLKRDFPQKDVEPLLNAIHYSTVSFKTAPAWVQELLE